MSLRAPVIHYTGHRIGGRNMKALHPGGEGRAARAIADELRRLAPIAAYGSLASGADILFAEACLARGAKLHVWLPFDARRFANVSVRPAGTMWVTRFERALAEATSATILPARRSQAASFAACADAAMRAAAQAGGSRAIQLAMWNGQAALGIAGTAADVAGWRARGLRTIVVGQKKEEVLF